MTDDTKVSVDTRINLAQHRSRRCVPGTNISQGVHDERAPVDVTTIHTIRRNRQPLYNLYARRTDRDNETARKKKKKERMNHRRLKRETRDRE